MEQNNALCETCQRDCKQLKQAIVIECPHYFHNGKRYIDSTPKPKTARRELTSREKTAIKKLVCQCANYDKSDNLCLPLDCCCYMLNRVYTGSALCRWFEQAVLPLNPKLEATLTGHIANTKPCGICGRQFALKGRKMYCSTACSEKARKEADKERARKYRRNKGASITQ